ncbi:hypothetical protein HN014_18700 [Aquimarina sp. TRL1]|uniref:hypothetical protein n=1 Tax=Aquimarina sp. (strain TRL1) TaxID=2736252 RepID=UPI001588FC8B|nr:hypothetical protein [Aquimarina sp. TRL1]QKX06860.1 hypothetical protein HN014_18700 [Aquimarina sp. TRL1]
MGEDLEIIPITKSTLREAVKSNKFWKDEVAPLPKSKATWLLQNNRIEEDDYCGIIAVEKGKIMAYILLFPDLINTVEKTVEKVYWMLLWWVHKKYKDTVLGTYFYREALGLTKSRVIIKSFAEEVNEFYKKQPFDVLLARERFTLFFSVEPSILVGRFPKLTPFKPVLKVLDKTVAFLVRNKNNWGIKKRTAVLSYEYPQSIDDKLWAFIAPLCKDDLILKTQEYVNWQLDYKQYTQVNPGDTFPYKSLLAGLSSKVYITNVAVKEGEKIIGFFSYVVNNKEFNIKYFLVEEEKKLAVIVDALMEHFIKEKTSFIFTDDAILAKKITEKYSAIFVYKKIKKALAHKTLSLTLGHLSFHNRDGHFF